MSSEQLRLTREEIPHHECCLKGYDIHTGADLCIGWDQGPLHPITGFSVRKTFLFRTEAGIYYAMIHVPGLPDEFELLTRNQALHLWRRLPEQLAGETKAFQQV